MEHAVLLFQCPDQQGLIARISALVHRCGGNILVLDQHTTAPEQGLFFMRLEFAFDPQGTPKEALEREFAQLAKDLAADWHISYSGQRLRCGVLVSGQLHCLTDLLFRHATGELDMDLALIASNHEQGRRWAKHYGIPFALVPAGADKAAAEAELLALVKDCDFLVLARYMQILSPAFLDAYGRDVINIHHSFLPSFKGSSPYQQAYDKGVKVIGATAHFVTKDLDEGPIIEQLVDRVSHRDDVEALKRKGRDLERMALARALAAYTSHRVIRHMNKTIVFE